MLDKGLTLKTELTAARLRELLHYDPETGHFTHLVSRGKAIKGERPTGISDDGYMRVMVDGRKYQLHRLAWLYVTGSHPAQQIDHRNRVRHDNRFSNLREALPVQNSQNLTVRATNPSGFLGVSRHGKKWRAAIAIHGRRKHLGRFHTPQQASEAYLSAKAALHPFAAAAP